MRREGGQDALPPRARASVPRAVPSRAVPFRALPTGGVPSGGLVRAFLFLLAGTLLAGCQVPSPPPVVETAPEVVALPEPEPARAPPPVRRQPEPIAGEPKSSVSVALLDTAGQLAATGRTDEAVETLERAIRIEPRRGDLWLRLARMQFNAGQFAQAEQNARKGLLFLTTGGEEARDAWLLIAAAREALGHIEEARSIRERWGVFRG